MTARLLRRLEVVHEGAQIDVNQGARGVEPARRLLEEDAGLLLRDDVVGIACGAGKVEQII
ncbi:hypothetical protein [Streptomyces coelicoflavus]|uniref:hypothetical protein n=1 Tax=Streptomyces coelicoflavus TaxID=285562 RepID=UPI002E26494E